jgi:hypothetical protein
VLVWLVLSAAPLAAICLVLWDVIREDRDLNAKATTVATVVIAPGRRTAMTSTLQVPLLAVGLPGFDGSLNKDGIRSCAQTVVVSGAKLARLSARLLL